MALALASVTQGGDGGRAGDNADWLCGVTVGAGPGSWICLSFLVFRNLHNEVKRHTMKGRETAARTGKVSGPYPHVETSTHGRKQLRISPHQCLSGVSKALEAALLGPQMAGNNKKSLELRERREV